MTEFHRIRTMFLRTSIVQMVLTAWGLMFMLSACHRTPNQTGHSQGGDGGAYIDSLNQKAYDMWSKDVDSMLHLSRQALDSGQTLNYSSGTIRALMNLGSGYYQKGDYSQSIGFYKEAIQYAEDAAQDSLQAQIRSNMAMPLTALGIYPEAIENLYEALALAERFNLKSTIAHVYHNLGMVYHYQLDYKNAIQYYARSRAQYESIQDSSKTTFILGNIAHIYVAEKKYDKAWDHYMESFRLAKKEGNQKGIGNALSSLGALSLEENKNLLALDYLYQAKSTLEVLGEKTEFLRLLQNLSECYHRLGENSQALHYAQEGYDLAAKQQQLWYIKTFAQQLSDLHEQNHAFREALGFQKIARSTTDTLSNRNTNDKLLRMEERYAYEKRQQDIDLQHTKALNRKQEVLYIFAFITLTLSILIALILYHVKRQKTTNKLLTTANRQILEQHQKLKDADSFKAHLLSIVAHDIRTPLSNVRMLLDLLKNKGMTPREESQLVSSSQSQIESLVSFIDNLLRWVLTQIKAPKTNPQQLDLGKLVDEIVRLYQPYAERKNVLLSVIVQEHTLVYADGDMLKIIVRNLLDNALKFCEEGDKIIVSSSFVEDDPSKIKVFVADTGLGMDRETQENLFSKAPITDREGRVSGLGLMLCQRYLELHDSTLQMESEIDKGSTFWFLLSRDVQSIVCAS